MGPNTDYLPAILSEMRILGIDPGIGRLGWGIVEAQSSRVTPVVFDCFETSKHETLPERLCHIYDFLSVLLTKEQVDAVSIEDLFFANNAKTAFQVGQARGVVLLVAAQQQLPIFTYTPLQVKVAVTGYGRAEKKQVGEMVKALLHLSAVPRPDDTADALAIALTHAFSRKMLT